METYICAYCTDEFDLDYTDDHTPLARLICPVCCKKHGIEVQTHPPDDEEAEDGFYGC